MWCYVVSRCNIGVFFSASSWYNMWEAGEGETWAVISSCFSQSVGYLVEVMDPVESPRLSAGVGFGTVTGAAAHRPSNKQHRRSTQIPFNQIQKSSGQSSYLTGVSFRRTAWSMKYPHKRHEENSFYLVTHHACCTRVINAPELHLQRVNNIFGEVLFTHLRYRLPPCQPGSALGNGSSPECKPVIGGREAASHNLPE